MFKSIAILWKGLATLAVVTILLAACAPSGQAPTSTNLSPLETPAVEENSAQVPTVEVGQAQPQPTESVAQAPTTEAATEVPTTAAAAEAPTTEAATEAPTTSAAEAPTTTAATESPTAVAGALQAPTTEATVVPTSTAATPEATVASSAGLTATTPTATAVSTPSTLPVTGGSDDGAAALTLIIIALGVAVLLGALGAAFARRSQ